MGHEATSTHLQCGVKRAQYGDWTGSLAQGLAWGSHIPKRREPEHGYAVLREVPKADKDRGGRGVERGYCR